MYVCRGVGVRAVTRTLDGRRRFWLSSSWLLRISVLRQKTGGGGRMEEGKGRCLRPLYREVVQGRKKSNKALQNKTQEVLTYAFYNLTGQNGEAPVAIIVKINQLHVVSARYVPEAVCTAKRRAARRPRAAQAGTHLLMHRRAWLAWGARALFVAQPQALGSVGREDGCACSSDF